MPKFNTYQEAVEYRNEELEKEYYDEEEEQEYDEMDEFDQYYDEMQDMLAEENLR